MAIMWPDRADEAISGDLTAALAYVTPAGGAVVTAVAPIGLRDRDAGTVSFTTSLGFGKKLERIERNPRVSLGYHAREHGFADSSDFVLVQGDAERVHRTLARLPREHVRPAATRFMGPPKEGKLFWDRWLREYYQDRVPVDGERGTREHVGRLSDCAGPAEVHGAPRPATRRRRPSRRTAPGRASTPSAPRGGCAASTTCCSPTSARTDIRRSCRSRSATPGPTASACRAERAPAARRTARGARGPLVSREADRPRRAPAHGLADRRRRGSGLRTAHRERVPALRPTRPCCCSSTACSQSSGLRRARKAGRGGAA